MTILKLIISHLLFIPYLINVFILRPVITVLGKKWQDWKWNGGICKKCHSKWILTEYDSDAVFRDKWECKCGRRFRSTIQYDELTIVQVKERVRETKLKKLI